MKQQVACVVACVCAYGALAFVPGPVQAPRGPLTTPIVEGWRCRHGGSCASTAGGAEGEQPDASDILGQIFKGAKKRRANSGEAVDWAMSAPSARAGCVLVANPAVLCKGSGRPDLAERFFLPADLPALAAEAGAPEGQLDNIANLLPVVLVTGNGQGGSTGLVLNRRTGYLVGDLNIESSGFKIQPVHLGGTTPSDGILMLHPYPDVPGSVQVTEDGLLFGGNYTAAQEMVQNAKGVSFRFKFFIQQTSWGPGELEREVEEQAWFPAEVGREVLLKSRGREGTKMIKPLWTEVLELMGGTYKQLVELYYRGEL